MTESDFDKIVDRIHQGDSIKSVLESLGISPGKFFSFVSASPPHLVRFELAQQSKAELLADEVVHISDSESDSQRARNRMDARRWYAAKIKPQRYGDRVDLHINHTVDIGAALLDAQQRVRHILDGAQQSQQQVIETTAKQLTHATDQQSVACPDKNELDDILS